MSKYKSEIYESLEEIEDIKRSWKSEFIRKLEIWEEIAGNINRYKGKKQEHWITVMDLYYDVYKSN